MGPRELCQISIGHLAVTDDAVRRDSGIRNIVRPGLLAAMQAFMSGQDTAGDIEDHAGDPCGTVGG